MIIDAELYYTPFSEKEFSEIKEAAIEIWQLYDDTYGYASGKIDEIKNVKNIRDNGMYIIAMFDSENQQRLSKMLTSATRVAVSARISSTGTPDFYNEFKE
jgi:hypothetical protein